MVQSRSQDLVSRTRPTTGTSAGGLGTRPASSAASSEPQSRPSTTRSTPTGTRHSSPSRASHSRHHGAHLAALDEDTQQQLLRHAEQDFLRSRKQAAQQSTTTFRPPSHAIDSSSVDGELAAFASPRQMDAQRESMPSLYEFETEIEIYRVGSGTAAHSLPD